MTRLFDKKDLTGIFAAAVAVGLAHYGITGMEDGIASGYVGVHAGWGALALTVYRAFRDRVSGAAGNEEPPEKQEKDGRPLPFGAATPSAPGPSCLTH